MSRQYGTEANMTTVKIYRRDLMIVKDLATLRACNMADATHELIQLGLLAVTQQPRNVPVSIPGIVVDGGKVIGIEQPNIAGTSRDSLAVYCPRCQRSHLPPIHATTT